VARYLAIRLGQTIPVVVAALLAAFLLLKVVPGDPARAIAGPRATDETVEAIRSDLGLDRPLPVQFGNYVGRVVRGDLGTTTTGSVPVTTLIRENGVVTVWLVAAGTLMSLVIALPLAVLAARRPDRAADHVVRVGSLVGLALPTFWVGMMLATYVALPTGWFPVGGWPDDLAGRLRAIVLPALTIAVGIAPLLVRSLRVSLIRVFDSEYVAAGRSIGLSGWRLTRRWVLRNAIVPVVSLLATLMGYLLFGAVLVEVTFGLPGLGQTMVSGAVNRDFNIVQGLTLVLVLGVVTINLLADVLLALIDPRISLR
jgi:peptide/nickel transport system permease protein